MENKRMTREEVCEFLVKTRIEHEPTTFENISFIGEDLSEIAFMNCDFVNCRFSRCNLTDTDFTGSAFRATQFSFCDMTRTNLNKCHLTSFWFDMCYLNCAILCYSTLKNGGMMDCRICECDMVQTYQFNTSMTRGYLGNTIFEYSTLIDVAYYNTEFVDVNYHAVDSHHITMDNVSLTDTTIEPFGDEVTVYGGCDNQAKPVEEYKEFTVHLNVNTKGEASVSLIEEV